MNFSLSSRCPSTVAVLLLALPVPALAQSGFQWDYPDGLGVRYLLYGRIERSQFKAKDFPPEMRALFQPKSKSDWVRINGTSLAWGMHVYEFPAGDAGGSAGGTAGGTAGGEAGDAFGRFLRERDPRRTFREFKVDGEPMVTKGREGRRWEFVDTWRPFVEVLDRPQPRGPYRYAVSPELGVRFFADKTMDYVDPFVGTDGDNCFARLHPAPNEWLRIDGVPGPVAWMLRVHVFPDMPREQSSSDRDDLVATFATFVDQRDPRRKKYAREIEVRDQAVDGASTPHRLWRWIDTRSDANQQTAACFHTVAAVYDIDGREVALLGIAPSDEKESRPEPMDRLEKMVTSLEPWSGKASAKGFAFYNVASSCRVGDREVGIVVHVPYGTDPRPDRKLLEVARRMVKSLEPADDDGKR